MCKKEVKVNTKSGIKTLLLSEQEKEQLKQELAGSKPYIQEYKTRSGKIISDLEILSIIKEP